MGTFKLTLPTHQHLLLLQEAQWHPPSSSEQRTRTASWSLPSSPVRTCPMPTWRASGSATRAIPMSLSGLARMGRSSRPKPFLESSTQCSRRRLSLRFLLEWDESGRVGRSDAGSAVSNWLGRHRKFGQIITDNFGLDFNLVENLSVVDADDGANHLGNDDDRSKMGLDASGLGSGLVGVNSSLRSSKSLEEVFLSALDASGV